MKNKFFWFAVLCVISIIFIVIFLHNKKGVSGLSSTVNVVNVVNVVPNSKSNTLQKNIPKNVQNKIQDKTSNIVQESNASKYVVVYSDKGFSPKTIQVPRGQVVRFINNSSTSLLIVADDQNSPLLNEINQPKAVAKGGVYVFDFTYAGIWAYHNASVPDDHGNIVVY